MYVIYKSPDFGKYNLYVGIISNPTEKAKTFVVICLFCEVYLKPVVSFKTESLMFILIFLAEEKHSAFSSYCQFESNIAAKFCAGPCDNFIEIA